MFTLFFVILFCIGTCFGSFSTVLIERWKSGKWGILFGRSECPKCGHRLSAGELIPLFSYIFQRGKCRNCHTTIPLFYPIVEVFMGILFIIAGIVLYKFGYFFDTPIFYIVLFWFFVTGVYIIYDVRYMEIPDQILIPAIYGTFLLLLLGGGNIGEFFLFDIGTYRSYQELFFDHITAAIVLYTFLYIQILIPGSLYLLRKKNLKSTLSLIGNYFTFPITLPLTLILKRKTSEQEEEIIPTWVGGGDLRIALFIGLSLGMIHGIASFIIAYITGSIIGVALLVVAKIQGRKFNHEIPFGPFLGFGWIISLVFYEEILNYITNMSI